MKKALYGLMIAGMISGTALAGGPDVPMGPSFRPFLGVNYSYLSVDNNSTFNGANAIPWNGDADSFNGMGFEAGLKYGHYLGFVSGWNHYFSETSGSTAIGGGTTASRVSPEMFYFDVRGYWPVMAQLNLIGSVGAGFLDAQSVSATVSVDWSQLNLRLGAGLDYWFTHNWGVQGMFHWSPSHDTAWSAYDSFWTITTGVYYMFD